MALNWSTTSQTALNHGIKVGVYGLDGVGKTALIPSCPRPIIGDIEGKTLTIAEHNIRSQRIHTWEDCVDFYNWLVGSAESRNYDTVAWDSFSTLAEILLAEQKRKNKDARRAYQEHRDILAIMIRNLIALPEKNVLFICKAALIDQPDGTKIYSPALPGTTADTGIGYYLNELFRLTISHYPGPADEKGNPTTLKVHWLQTQQDAFAQARDNSRILLPQEKPDLGYIFNKIKGAFRSEVPQSPLAPLTFAPPPPPPQ